MIWGVLFWVFCLFGSFFLIAGSSEGLYLSCSGMAYCARCTSMDISTKKSDCLVFFLWQWHRTPTTQETDGFQVKRPGDVSVRCTLLLMLDYQVSALLLAWKIQPLGHSATEQIYLSHTSKNNILGLTVLYSPRGHTK